MYVSKSSRFTKAVCISLDLKILENVADVCGIFDTILQYIYKNKFQICGY